MRIHNRRLPSINLSQLLFYRVWLLDSSGLAGHRRPGPAVKIFFFIGVWVNLIACKSRFYGSASNGYQKRHTKNPKYWKRPILPSPHWQERGTRWRERTCTPLFASSEGYRRQQVVSRRTDRVLCSKDLFFFPCLSPGQNEFRRFERFRTFSVNVFSNLLLTSRCR